MNPIGHSRNHWHANKDKVDLQRKPNTPNVVSFDAAPQQLTLDLNKAALIIVDMQNDFCSKGGWLSHIGGDYEILQRPIKPLQSLLPLLRAEAIPIIWVNWGNREDRSNLSPSVLHVYNQDGLSVGIGEPLPENGSRVLQKGSWGAAIVDDLEVKPDDICVDKFRMSGFIDTPLDSILRNLRVETLLFAGVNLDQCVMATLQDAVNYGYDSIVLEDCCATNSPSFCLDATIYNVKQCYGFVAHSSGLFAALQQKEALNKFEEATR